MASLDSYRSKRKTTTLRSLDDFRPKERQIVDKSAMDFGVKEALATRPAIKPSGPSFLDTLKASVTKSAKELPTSVREGLLGASQTIQAFTDPLGAIQSDRGVKRDAFAIDSKTGLMSLQKEPTMAEQFTQQREVQGLPQAWERLAEDTQKEQEILSQAEGAKKYAANVAGQLPQIPLYFTPLGLPTLGLSAAGQKRQELAESGAPVGGQLMGAGLSGLAETGTEALTFGAVKGAVGSKTLKEAAMFALQEPFTEFFGESITQAVDPFINKLTIPEYQMPSVQEQVSAIKEAGFTGALAAVLLMGAGTGVNSVSRAIQTRSQQDIQQAVEDVEKSLQNEPQAQEVVQKAKSELGLQQVGQQARIDEEGPIKPPANIQGIFEQVKTTETQLADAPTIQPTIAEDTGLAQPSLEVQPSDKIKSIFEKATMAEDVGLQAELSQPSGVSTTVMPETVLPSGAEAVFKPRGFGQNIATDINRNEALSREFEKSPEWYEQLANQTTLERAQAIFDKGFDKALKEFDQTKGTLTTHNVVLSKLLADQAAENGDIQTARRIIADMAEVLTEAGRMSQASKILRESNSPAAIIDFIEREIKKLNEQGRKRFGEKRTNLFGRELGWNEIKLTDADMKIVNEMQGKTAEEQARLFEQLFDRINTQIPVTKREKIDALRRMAMLMNPKTHIRNFVGNGIMGGIKKVSDAIATAGEKLIPKELRTKALMATPQRKATAREFYEANKQDLNEGSRWEIFGVKSPFADRRIFDNEYLEKLNQFGKDTLEGEDLMFFSRHYVSDLSKFMQARGLNKVTQEASDYALRRAQEATFRQNNEFANAINKFKKGRGGILVEAAMPFTKTPANIAKSGIEYSPIGLANGAVKIMMNNNLALGIEQVAKGLTGTGLVILGAYMAAMGLARGDYDRKDEGLMQQLGRVPNSITIGDISYSIDWAQPAAIPFLMGVAFYEQMNEDTDASVMDATLNAIYKGGDTLIDQSMLRGIKDLFGGYGTATEKVASLPTDYVSQLFPTLLGQVARSVDPVKRQRDYSTTLKEFGSGVKAKIPFATMTMPAKRDIFGQEQQYGEGIGNVLQQFFSPGYVGIKSDDKVVKELEKLYNEVGSEVVPRYTVSSFSSGGKSYKLTPEEKSEFQKIMGEYTYTNLEKLISSSSYSKASTETKVDKINEINNDGYKKAKEYIINKRKP